MGGALRRHPPADGGAVVTNTDAAWNTYAEERRRLDRMLADPLAAPRQVNAQRRVAQRTFAAFYRAFCGRPQLEVVA